MREFYFAGIILVFLVLAGCGPSSTGNRQSSVHIGTQGLEMSFASNAPPPKVYSSEPLDVILELRNKGAYPSSEQGQPFEGRVFLSGYDPTYIHLDPVQDIPADLFGRDEFNTEGGYSMLRFFDSAVSLPVGTDRYAVTLMATSCYHYATLATATVCIDPMPYTTKVRDKVCNINNVQLSGGQGGPVGISNIDEEVSANKIKFKITIRNMGSGRIIDPTLWMAQCPNFEYYSLDYVYLYAQLSSAELTCKPANPVKLVNGEGFVICEAMKPSETVDPYVTPLQVLIDYAYSDSITRSLEVVES